MGTPLPRSEEALATPSKKEETQVFETSEWHCSEAKNVTMSRTSTMEAFYSGAVIGAEYFPALPCLALTLAANEF